MNRVRTRLTVEPSPCRESDEKQNQKNRLNSQSQFQIPEQPDTHILTPLTEQHCITTRGRLPSL